MKDQENPCLYMVSTPIGNLSDLSQRAIETLNKVNWIAAEDTRQTRKLLDSQGIHKELVSLHEHSGEKKIQDLVRRLKEGESGAYVSDAGTPGICDPGAELTLAAAAQAITVVPIPGASAPIALLSVCGFSSSEFTFRGFFPREKKQREEWSAKARAAGGVQVFFESPHRIRECLRFLGEAVPDQPLVIGRELTKKFETIHRGTARGLEQKLGSEEPRGEYVLALELPPAEPDAIDLPKIGELLQELHGLGANQKTLLRVAMSHGLAKNAAYELALKTLGKA